MFIGEDSLINSINNNQVNMIIAACKSLYGDTATSTKKPTPTQRSPAMQLWRDKSIESTVLDATTYDCFFREIKRDSKDAIKV